MQTCSRCGALSPATAGWCGQCCLVFAGEPVETAALAPVGVAPTYTSTHPSFRPVEPAIPAAPTPFAALPPPSMPPVVPPSPSLTGSPWLNAPPPPPWLNAPPPAWDDGRLLDRRAGILVAAAIGLGGIMQLIGVGLAHSTSLEPDTIIRYDIVLTLGLYAVVAALVLSQFTPSIRLRWGSGPLLSRVAIGAGAGIGFSLLLLALVSSASGHLRPDPRIVLLMSEGDPTHIVITALIACVAAPLVEETLFRGLLLESLRPRGTQVALLVSSGAFAVWHFMPTSLVYYAALGAALGGLYIKRGLACSLAAHVGFNGVLTVAAIMVVLGPSHVVTVGNVNVTAPSGWSAEPVYQQFGSPDGVLLVGPADAQLAIVQDPTGTAATPDEIAQRLRSGVVSLPNVTLDTASVDIVDVPAGQVVEAAMTVGHRQGTLAMLTANGTSYEFVFLSAGSAKAQQDFSKMMTSVKVT